MKQFLTVIILSMFIIGCTKKNNTTTNNTSTEPTPAPQKVTVYFSTQLQNIYWYLYTVKNGDTIRNFSTTNVPYNLKLWYASTLPNGWNTAYSHLELMTETDYQFGTWKNKIVGMPTIEPLKTYKFHIKDTLNTGVISIFVNN